MGKVIKMALAALLACAMCSSCDWKDPIDEDIEGFWRLENFETNNPKKIHRCERLYFGITRMVVEVSEKGGTNGYGDFVARFEYKDGHKKVVMRDFKRRAATSDAHENATVEELLPFGMNATTTEFEVVVADGDNLVLRSDYATLQLKRF